MPQMKRIDDGTWPVEPKPTEEKKMPEEESEDYLDYCAAAEAIDEALETGEIRSFEDFAKEVGI
ncbi:MAG: hypothetical protein HY913_17835 [Desulfomonile tiedjei]|nr:hypothetical protein [Desulfomonile tiedjei]